MVSDKSINLLIIHQSEEEAERILSLLRNYQIAVRPSRCIDEDGLIGILERKPIQLVLCQQLQSDLPTQTAVDHIKRIGKDIPVISLLETLDSDLIHEALESGASNFCTPKLPDHMYYVITKERKNLEVRKRNTKLMLELQDTEKRCNILLDTSKQAIAYIHDGMHVYSNQSYQELFKCDDFEEMEVTPFLNLVSKDDVSKAKKVIRNISKNIIPETGLEFNLIDIDNKAFKSIIHISKATINGEECAQFIINKPSTSPEVEKELFEIKNKDLLTKFYNRSYLQNHLSDAIINAKNTKGDSLLFIHLDHTKEHETSLGKGNMDMLIVSLAEFIKKKLGKDVFYCRYANSVFVLQISISIEKAQQVAEKLVNLIGEEIFSAGDSSVNCTVSIAVTQLTPQSASVNEIMRILSNQAKKLVDAGGNSINVFDPAEEEKLARAASKVWIDKITDGLQNDQFCLHYQSIVNINGDEKDHYEVLVRLNSDMDLIYPKQFIPIAMRHGFIQDIDQWVIKKVIKVALEQQKNIMFYIKLSPSTLTNPSFPSWLSDQLRKAGLSGEKFAFEIKESELITHAKKMKPIIKSIKGLNCSIVVEKFGSGLNSFTILKHFPVDLLKIDSSFMEDLATDEETQAKVREIIEKAHAQGKLVICEFVEDANTMSTLWKLSVNFVQGNFIAPPSEKLAHIE